MTVDANERRGPVLAAARRVCERGGVARASMRAVATEAGIPMETLLGTYPSWTDMLRALLGDVEDEIDAALRTIAPDGPGLAAALRAAVTTLWEQMVGGPDGRGLQPLEFELGLASMRAGGETLSVTYEELAQQTLAFVDGLVTQHLVDPESDRGAALLETGISLLTAGAAPRTVD